MSMGVILAIALVVAMLVALGAHLAPRLREPDGKDLAFLIYEQVAQEVGGLACVATDRGWPRLRGFVEGMSIEIDQENDVAYGLEGMLGLRCAIPEAMIAPNAAIWVGEVATLHSQYGRPRAYGDPDALFDVYTRADPSASDWWQEPELLETLRSLPGGGLLLYEGQLTVVFSDLDGESVRIAMRIPSLIRQGVARVTVH